MKVTVEVQGLPELKRELERLSRAAQTRLLRNATMAKYARQRVPVLTGALKRSIMGERTGNGAVAR